MFQNLQQGATIYILDKSSKVPVLKTGVIVKMGAPTAVYNTQTPGLLTGFQQKAELTIRAKVDNSEGDFAHLLTDEKTHDYGTMVVADSRESMLGVVETISQQAQQRLDNRDNDLATIDACSEMYKVLNPNYAKEKERDEAIDKLNSRLDRMEDSMESSMEKILKLLNKKA